MIVFLKLVRYKNLLMVLLTMVLTKYALLDSFKIPSPFTDFHFVVLTLSVLLITASGYIINDIFDIEADKINSPNRPLTKEEISKSSFITLYFLINIVGIGLGIFVSFLTKENAYSIIFISTSFLLFIYSWKLKKIFIIGNILVSLLVFMSLFIVLLFGKKLNYSGYCDAHGFSACLNRFFAVFSYSFFAFLTTLIREIIKDIEDVNGDLKIKAKTLPIVIGRKRASYVAFFFSCILLIFLTLVLKLLQKEILFLSYGILFIFLPLLYFLFLLWKAETKKQYSKLSSLMKFIMFFGILSMLFFRFLDTSSF